MTIKKFGSGKNKILIVHGWLHNSTSYFDFSKKLMSKCDCEVHLFNVPSFGCKKTVTCNNMLNTFGKMLGNYMATEKYDLMIGHSMGGQLIIRGLEDLKIDKIPKVILVNPEYYGVNMFKPFCITPNFSAFLFDNLKKAPDFVKYPIAKALTSFFFISYELIDDTLIDIALTSEPKGAFFMLRELALDKRRIKNNSNFINTIVVYSEYDKIISRKKIKMLMKDGNIKKLIVIKSIGHITVFEAEEKLLNIAVNFLKKNKL